ncbi:uncharacterized protein LY89DRAFT_753348 [Mollisia scopiformis]|uniref:Uncharacterized protein n=1 Tax=Mollisia scopiformis TaxID=149040 RepID=A0A194X187_MOLSC|nr:uncharacterized protein LY89DRAFT_753348 [Mollisia scopiformis]KUJ13961.1 hypothetical protein LY89DRAFT_753348 [Mollisia scopiformis]
MAGGNALIPLKYMAENPGQLVRTVPCGMYHNESHKFRSRLGLEFASPIEISDNIAALYKAGQQNEAIPSLRKLVGVALHNMTLSHSNNGFDKIVDIMESLYGGSNARLHQKSQRNKELWRLYLQFESDPNFQRILYRMYQYQRRINLLGVESEDIGGASKSYILLLLLGLRFLELALAAVLRLPGLILFGPLPYLCNNLAQRYAERLLKNSAFKLTGRDVLASAKMLNALKFTTLLYIASETAMFAWLHWNYLGQSLVRVIPAPFAVVLGLTLISFIRVVSIWAWDRTVDVLRSILVLLILADPRKACMRESLEGEKRELEVHMWQYIVSDT